MESISAVTAQLKEGHYSSAADYMSTAKAQHLKRFEWSSMLARHHSICIRSALRGIGPAKQSEEIPLHIFVTAAKSLTHVTSLKRPFGLQRMGVVAYFFMLREIEASTMLYTSVDINVNTMVISILLSASKTDPCALSVTRRWGCVCLGDPCPDECPFHAGLEQQQELEKAFGKEAIMAEGFPFFPTRQGTVVSKEAMAQGIQDVAHAAGYTELRDLLGRLLFTGQAFRIGGSRSICKSPYS